MKKYVIVGNGTAAVGTVEGIRSVDRGGSITLISEEPWHVYSRPLISYYLEGKTDSERIKYRGDSFYDDNGCSLLLGKRAVSVNAGEKTVALDDGSVLEYDELCVAAGSRPFVPPFEGLHKVKNKFGFMTFSDALALEKALSKDANVLIVGAGLIGLKCAEGIRDRVKSITVCDLADRVLSSILDNGCASIVMEHLEKEGLSFMLSDTVARFEENRAFMKSGRTVDFDILILAVGVRANSELVRDAGGSVNRGVIVNERMETSLAGVYAAGDCAEGFDSSIGANRVLAIMPNAYMQGHTAGVNMAGGSSSFANAIPMNSVGFFGLHMMTAGAYTGEMKEIKGPGSLKRFFTQDGLLKGFIMIGETVRAGILTSLIRDKVPLDTVDLSLIGTAASSMIFSPEARRKKFGGVV